MFRILLLVLELLSGKSHRPGVCNSIQAGSEVLEPGMKLDEFVLIERLHSWSLDKQSQSSGSDASWIAANSSSLELVQTMPTGLLQMKSSEDLPANVTNSIGSKYKVLKRLASGGFGEVWKAVGPDTKTVAIKLFYTKGDNGKLKYHTYNDSDEKVQRIMKEEEQACNEVKQLVKDAEAEHHSAQVYIAKCIESRLSNEPNKIGYLVQEYGGQQLSLLGLENRAALQVLIDARQILFQLLSVLDLLASQEPKLSHHYLTPANIVWQRTEQDRILIKVANWHAFMDPSSRDTEVCEYSETYLPPEYWDTQKHEIHPCDFIIRETANPNVRANPIEKYDIYAAGLVYAVVLLLAGGGSPPMTQKDLKEELEGIQEIWTSNSNILATAVTEKMKSYAKEHGWYFRDEDRQLLERLTSKLPGNRPAAIDAIGSIGNLGHSLQNLVRTDLVHRLTSPPGRCRESSFGSAVQNTYTHRTYTFEKIDGTYDEVKLTILKNGKIKAEGAPFHLHQCILNTLLDTTRRKDYDWCCRSSYDYMSKTGPSLTGAKTATKMDVTFCVDSKTLDGARDLVINMMESGDNLKVNSNHVIQMTKFSQKHCSASP
mmetsp:Transcript_98717/g.189486  ORF Transcript_98717/g.189486 Transcript_98717/m.189486 type:complete len:599 (+) Transcript_98717:109-1905(+)